MLDADLRAFLCTVLHLSEDDACVFREDGGLEAVLERLKVSSATFASVLPFCGTSPLDLATYVGLLKVAADGIIQRGEPLDDMRHLMGMSPNAFFRATVNVLLQVHQLRGYWRALLDGGEEVAVAWLENLAVCRLNLEGARKRVTGTALIPVADVAAQRVDGVLEEYPPSWLQLFGGGKFCGRQRGLDLSKQPTDFVMATLAAGAGKIVLAGGAVLAHVTRGAPPVRDYDFWVVGCASVAQAVAVIRVAARALISSLVRGNDGNDNLGGERVLAALTPNAITLVYQCNTRPSVCAQFVLRNFNDTEHVLTSFDLGPCCFAMDAEGAVHTTGRGKVATQHGFSIADPCQHCTPQRAHKYDGKGYNFVLPVWGEDWRRTMLDPLAAMPSAEAAQLAFAGGARGLLAFAYLQQLAGQPRSRKRKQRDSEVGQLYDCLYQPELLFNEEVRSRFLARFTGLRAYSHHVEAHGAGERKFYRARGTVAFEDAGAARALVDRVLPDELFEAAGVVEGQRWSRDPAQRMHDGAAGFYEGFP